MTENKANKTKKIRTHRQETWIELDIKRKKVILTAQGIREK